MKKIVLYITAICCFSSIVSCNYLDEMSQDEVRPSSVDDLVQLMLGEGYLKSTNFLNYLDLLTDDVQSSYPSEEDAAGKSCLDKYQAIYSWDEHMYEYCKEKGVVNYNHWEFIYQKIMGCNVVLSMIDDVKGEKSSRENLRGQAYAMRAYYYFILANLYAMPYTYGNPESILAVPIIKEPQVVDSYPQRASLADVYALILSDLGKALPLLEEYGKNNIVYRASDKFTNALLSRVYLYMGNWKLAAEYATNVIKEHPALQNLSNSYSETIDEWWGDITYEPNYQQNVYGLESVECLWAYGTSKDNSMVYEAPSPMGEPIPAFSISDELNDLYVNDESGAVDERKTFYMCQYLVGFDDFFQLITRPLFGDKGNRNGSSNGGFRTSEMYLNRAEANLMLVKQGQGGSISDALADLNTLREARFDTKTYSYTPISISSVDELLNFCKEERRRELTFEGHRWFDMRRWGMLGFKHSIELTKGTVKEIVFNNPKKYALPIPLEVIERNPMIKPNVY